MQRMAHSPSQQEAESDTLWCVEQLDGALAQAFVAIHPSLPRSLCAR